MPRLVLSVRKCGSKCFWIVLLIYHDVWYLNSFLRVVLKICCILNSASGLMNCHGSCHSQCGSVSLTLAIWFSGGYVFHFSFYKVGIWRHFHPLFTHNIFEDNHQQIRGFEQRFSQDYFSDCWSKIKKELLLFYEVWWYALFDMTIMSKGKRTSDSFRLTFMLLFSIRILSSQQVKTGSNFHCNIASQSAY